MSLSYNVATRVTKRMGGYIQRLLDECQEKNARIAELEFERDEAYAAGASVVLNSSVVKRFVPTKTRRNLRPGRFAVRAARVHSQNYI